LEESISELRCRKFLLFCRCVHLDIKCVCMFTHTYVCTYVRTHLLIHVPNLRLHICIHEHSHFNPTGDSPGCSRIMLLQSCTKHTCICVHKHTYICVHIHTCMHIHTCTHIHTYVCTYTNMYAHTHTHVCTYTHTHTPIYATIHQKIQTQKVDPRCPQLFKSNSAPSI